MTATWTEALPKLISLLDDGWTRANSDNIKPKILDIATVTPEHGKRLDLGRHDYVLLYETAHNEEAPELFYNFVTTRINLTVDLRTVVGRTRLQKMENELRRVVHTNRKGDGNNFDRLIFKTRVDLSDRTKRLFRQTFQIEMLIFAEQIP